MIITKTSAIGQGEAVGARKEAVSVMAPQNASLVQKAEAEKPLTEVDKLERGAPPQASSAASGLRGASGEAAAAIEQEQTFPAPLKVALSAYMQSLPSSMVEEIQRLTKQLEAGKPAASKPAEGVAPV